MAAWESSSELNLAAEEGIKKTANDKQRGREMRVMKFLFRTRQRKLNGCWRLRSCNVTSRRLTTNAPRNPGTDMRKRPKLVSRIERTKKGATECDAIRFLIVAQQSARASLFFFLELSCRGLAAQKPPLPDDTSAITTVLQRTTFADVHAKLSCSDHRTKRA